MAEIDILVKLNDCEQPDGSSHKVDSMDYVSESGNCYGTCTKCGEKLGFYIGSYNDSIFIYIINSGMYLLHTSEAYKKINIEKCTGKKNILDFFPNKCIIKEDKETLTPCNWRNFMSEDLKPKPYVIKSRRYFDQDNTPKVIDKKKVNLIVFEGAANTLVLKQIFSHFINKYKNDGYKVVTVQQPVLPQQLRDQLKNPVHYFVTMCRLTGEWYEEKVKPELDKGNLVLLNHYYHRYLTNALVMEIQKAQEKIQKKLKIMEQQGKPMPEELPPLEVDERLIVELQEQYTNDIPEPDILFACFDGSDLENAFISKAFSTLFNTDPNTYTFNTFYGLESVVKEMEVRLGDYEVCGKEVK